jgi:hypothetical protein
MSDQMVRTGRRDGYAGPAPVIVTPAPNTATPAFGKSHGVAEVVRSIASHGPRMDAHETVAAPGVPLDKELKSLDYRRSRPPRSPIFHGPIANPAVWIPASERRDRGR